MVTDQRLQLGSRGVKVGIPRAKVMSVPVPAPVLHC